MSDTILNSNDTLEGFCKDLVSQAKQNRKVTEEKWYRNIRDVAPETLTPAIAGYNEKWRQAEGTTPGSSQSRLGVTASKIQSAHDFCEDVVLKNGVLPFSVSADDDDGDDEVQPVEMTEEPTRPVMLPGRTPGSLVQPNPAAPIAFPPQAQAQAQAMLAQELQPGVPAGPATEQDKTAAREAIEEPIEKFVDKRLKKCGAAKQLMRAFDDSATYGERYCHVFTVRTKNGGTRWCFEAVSPWECFRDIENDGPLSEGEYFIRHQLRSPWRIMQDAREHDDIYDLAAMEAELGKSFNATNAGNDADSDPRSANIINRTKLTDFYEVWAWVPRKMVMDWELAHP